MHLADYLVDRLFSAAAVDAIPKILLCPDNLTVDVNETHGCATAREFFCSRAPESAARTGYQDRLLAEIVLNGHARPGYFTFSFQAATSRTIHPELGSQK